MGFVRFSALIRAVAEYIKCLDRNTLRSMGALDGDGRERVLGSNIGPQPENTSGADATVGFQDFSL